LQGNSKFSANAAITLNRSYDVLRSSRKILFYSGKNGLQTVRLPCGAVAQLIERVVRNDEVVGLIPICSTTFSLGVLAAGAAETAQRAEARAARNAWRFSAQSGPP
jgi:hypothetical protein